MFGDRHKNEWTGFEGTPERDLVQQVVYQQLIPDIQSLGKQEISKILDIGCGVGLFTQELLHLFPDAQVHGIDKLYPFQNQIGEESISYRQGDISQGIPYEEEFQFCISKFVVMYLRDLGHHFSEVARILSTGGQYFIVTFNPEYTLEKQKHVHNRNVSYGDEVEHEIIGANLKVKLLLHSPNDYYNGIQSAGFKILSEKKVMFPNPKFEFARHIPFAHIFRLQKLER